VTFFLLLGIIVYLWPSRMAPPQPPAPKAEFPNGVPLKFAPDGTIQHFPGNTIISHLSPSSPLYTSMLRLHAKLAAHPLSHLYALLPPSSWHMTIFEGVCDKVRSSNTSPDAMLWPKDLPPDATLSEVTTIFATRLRAFNLQCDPPYQVSWKGRSPLKTGITLSIDVGSEETRLRDLRDRLSATLGIRGPKHGEYKFHMAMAYLLRHLTAEQKAEIDRVMREHEAEMPKTFHLGAPEFVTFENMSHFDRHFYLQDQVQHDGGVKRGEELAK
jgi:hypothetical protein